MAYIQISPDEAKAFAQLTGDYNPVHDAAAMKILGKPAIAHGMQLELMIAALAEHYSGAMLSSLEYFFKLPLKLGESAEVVIGINGDSTIEGKCVKNTTENSAVNITAKFDASRSCIGKRESEELESLRPRYERTYPILSEFHQQNGVTVDDIMQLCELVYFKTGLTVGHVQSAEDMLAMSFISHYLFQMIEIHDSDVAHSIKEDINEGALPIYAEHKFQFFSRSDAQPTYRFNVTNFDREGRRLRVVMYGFRGSDDYPLFRFEAGLGLLGAKKR